MTYELAKELKDAGFPEGNKQFIERDGTIIGINEWHNDAIFSPTLEELIEACGKDFIALDKKADGQWLAGGGRREKEYFSYQLWGDTPSEAVARLWLALKL